MGLPACMSEDGNTSVFIGTFLEDGTAVALCNECLVPFMCAVVTTMTGVDTAPVLAEWQDKSEADEMERVDANADYAATAEAAASTAEIDVPHEPTTDDTPPGDTNDTDKSPAAAAEAA